MSLPNALWIVSIDAPDSSLADIILLNPSDLSEKVKEFLNGPSTNASEFLLLLGDGDADEGENVIERIQVRIPIGVPCMIEKIKQLAWR